MPIPLSGDSSMMPNNQCSNCITFGSKCEHSPRRTKVSNHINVHFGHIHVFEIGTGA